MSTSPIKPKILVVLGPTASGKSDLAVQLAKKFNGEIISADSRQVYRGLDIGSGKITKREMQGIPHHMLDVASLKQNFDVARYQKLASKILNDILRRGKLPIIVGGTAQYIDTLLYNYTIPDVPPNTTLRRKLEKKSTDELFRELERRDPERAATIDRHNPRRLIRALEIVRGTNAPVPVLKKESRYEVCKIGIALSKELLKERLVMRTKKRLRKGMVAEIGKLHRTGISWKRLESLGFEYRLVSNHIHGVIPKKELEENMVRESLQYAKRQMQWWKRDKEIHWIADLDDAERPSRAFLSI